MGCRDRVHIDGVDIVELRDLVQENVQIVDGLGLLCRHVDVDFGFQLRMYGSGLSGPSV